MLRSSLIAYALMVETLSCSVSAKPFEPEQALAIIVTDKGQGSGFVASVGGTNYIITNTHVLSAVTNFDCYSISGQQLKTGRIEFEMNNDLARIRVAEFSGTPFMLRTASDPKLKQRVTVYGNSKGAGVVTEISGQVIGCGPAEIEVSADFVDGNSGSPIVDKDGYAIGVATYVTESEPTVASKGTRFSKARRMGIRLSEFNNSWTSVTMAVFYRQSSMLYDIHTLIAQFDEVQKLMFTEKENRIEKLTARTYLKVKETRWTDINYSDKAAESYHNKQWPGLLKEMCDAHDSLTAARYEGKASMSSHQVRMLMTRLNAALRALQQAPRTALNETSWVTPFYKLCGADLVAQMSSIDSGAEKISRHFNEGWK